MEKKDVKSMTLDELKSYMKEIGEKEFRGKQLYEWMHKKQCASYEEMRNIPVSLKEKCKEQAVLTTLELVTQQTSEIDGTTKFLFALEDGNLVESVRMRYKHGNSVCISTQVGCRMGCKFCASGIDGLVRNLTPAEMLEQIYRIQRYDGERVTNVVLMGTGEPLDNYDNVLRFLTLLSDENGLNISQRNITVSTCGLVPKIRQLAEEKLQITLALSLHAPNDEKRKAIMPVANSYSMEEVLSACRYYFEQTGRRITFEYSLVHEVNDSKADAVELSSKLRGLNCHVNLIPVNPVKELGFETVTRNAAETFMNQLMKCGVNATVRREMGRDIDGACGQLRRRCQERKVQSD